MAAGVGPGDRVALMSRTRVEWPLVDFAVMMAGGVTVTIYDTSSLEQIRWILSDSDARLAVVETAALRRRVEEAAPASDAPYTVMVIEDGALDALAQRGEAVPDDAVDERLAALGPDSLATLVYTSGTTGPTAKRSPTGAPSTAGPSPAPGSRLTMARYWPRCRRPSTRPMPRCRRPSRSAASPCSPGS